MEKYKIQRINLLKYYFYLLLNFVFSLILFTILIFRLTSNGIFIFGLIISFIIAIVLYKYVLKFSSEYIHIYLDKNKIEDSNEKKIIANIKDIQSYNFKLMLKSFPSFKLVTYNNEKYKFHCKNKADFEFDKFIIKFESVMKNKK